MMRNNIKCYLNLSDVHATDIYTYFTHIAFSTETDDVTHYVGHRVVS